METISLTLVERVMDDIRQRIDSQRLMPGVKLPSIRKFSEIKNVSKSTIVDAYDRLVAEGLIEARRGSGFYVLGHLSPLSLSKLEPYLDHAVDPLWVSRQSLEASGDVLKPGCGWLPADWMPEDAMRRALRSLSRSNQAVLSDYGTPHGFLPLREFISRRMFGYGIDAGLDQVVLTESGTQSIDLLCRFLIEPGDTVLIDDPCYFNFQALLKAHRVNVVSVPYTATGPDLILFERVLKEHKPRLYITNSAIHNPTGAVLSPTVAHGLLKLAEQSDLIIIEDDILADLEVKPAPRLAALDGLNRVIYIGSFSKTISASIRCGYISAKPEWIEGLIDLKIATSFGGGALSAELTYRVLKDGSYRKHLAGLPDRLSKARSSTRKILSELDIRPLIEPLAGMYLWCVLPDELDAVEVAKKALTKGVILAPGNVFSISGSADHCLRFNVAQSGSRQLYKVLEEVMSDIS